ncbi:hypothetical protein M9458_046244, partial [Cirrhinus mrigala]
VWCQQCGGPCQCQSSVPACPEGVPLILDGCQCCQVPAVSCYRATVSAACNVTTPPASLESQESV